MLRIHTSTLLILAFLISGCKQNKIENRSSTANTTPIQRTAQDGNTQNQESNSDTFVVQVGRPYIIAVALSQDGIDKLSETEAEQYNTAYDDLTYNLGRFAEKVNDKDLLIIETASRHIRVGETVINTLPGLIFITKTGQFEVVNEVLLDGAIEHKARSMNPPLIP